MGIQYLQVSESVIDEAFAPTVTEFLLPSDEWTARADCQAGVSLTGIGQESPLGTLIAGVSLQGVFQADIDGKARCQAGMPLIAYPTIPFGTATCRAGVSLAGFISISDEAVCQAGVSLTGDALVDFFAVAVCQAGASLTGDASPTYYAEAGCQAGVSLSGQADLLFVGQTAAGVSLSGYGAVMLLGACRAGVSLIGYGGPTTLYPIEHLWLEIIEP